MFSVSEQTKQFPKFTMRKCSKSITLIVSLFGAFMKATREYYRYKNFQLFFTQTFFVRITVSNTSEKTRDSVYGYCARAMSGFHLQ